MVQELRNRRFEFNYKDRVSEMISHSVIDGSKHLRNEATRRIIAEDKSPSYSWNISLIILYVLFQMNKAQPFVMPEMIVPLRFSPLSFPNR
jgi:hypothetical protein